jgi:hypothetical protein
VKKSSIRFVSPAFLFFCGCAIWVCHGETQGASVFPGMDGTNAAQGMSEPKRMPHMNDKPKHGGLFFMAQDGVHHVEGLLLPSHIFRLYIYDMYADPLAPEKMKEAKGTIQVGQSSSAAKIPLMLSREEETMQAALRQDLAPPVTVTLFIHFPDSPQDKPEKFTFHFKDYSEGTTPQMNSSPMNDPGDGKHMDQ